ncbi:MAG: alpha-methylacyl-CoA racemase [Zhongshania sp.]|jgi:alpha-methylacyl-CoA racemase
MGPLAGLKIIEIKGIGPGPYAGMLLADMGAEVTVVERSSQPGGIGLPPDFDCNCRGKKSIALNLKTKEGIEVLLKLVEKSDAIFEGFRPGVAERLGIGPDACMTRNPKIVYGRITGWGQTGPLAKAAGHDINYISITGSLAAIGREDSPVPPLNLIGDYAGGSHFLVMGMLAALLEAKTSGKGQVIDAAITDGSASLMSMFYSMDALGVWGPKRASNLLDGATHFYDVYKTLDGEFVSIGSIEPQFYALLIEHLQLDPEAFSGQGNASEWPLLKEKIAAAFKTKTQAQWCEIMEGSDVCFAPVLDYREAVKHPHNVARETYIEIAGQVQPAPAPRFSRTVSKVEFAPRKAGADTKSVLAELGYGEADLQTLNELGALT